MTSTLIDQDERRRIATDLNVNLCVEASAGTGKTTVLVSRIVEILSSGHTTVEKLAVITFTEKAAAELSARVREGLEKALAREQVPERSEKIRIALRDLNRARIETIHAFASSLLRERPIEAGLDPNFEVLDDLGSDLGFDEAYKRWLTEVLSTSSLDVRRAFNRGFEFPRLRELTELVHAHRSQLPLTLAEFPIRIPVDKLRALYDHVEELRGLLPQCKKPTDLGYQQIQNIIELFKEFQRCADRPEVLERVMLKPVTFKAAGNKSNWETGASDQQKEICGRLKDELLAYQNDLRTAALLGILPLVQDFVSSYAEERRQAGLAEFDDLLIWTRDLLRDQPEVRHYFQQQFDCVLVDEFQDTDPLQVEIVLYLTTSDTLEKDWRKLTPDTGKLFVVGDPKQSIYRFRRADIAIYEWVKNHILHDGLLTIQQNFRSVPGVITWVNEVFEQIIQPEDGIQPDYRGLVPARPDHHISHAPVILIRGSAESADAMRQEEARLLAGLIERAVRDECWPVKDGDAIRPAAWRDVAILLPTRTGIDFYEQAFSERDIPYRHEGGRAFFDRQEVRELVNCLKAIDDPTDRLSLVAALRSGAFGCSDDDIYHFVSQRGQFDLRREPDAPVPSVTEALAVLRRLHDLRGQLTLPEFVSRVLEETRLVEYAITLPQGQQAAANLLKIADQARAFGGVGSGGLRAFVRWLTTSSGGRADEADAAVAEARDDVVRLMTIHAAKGLEFPIVALANLNSNRRSNGSAAILDPNEQRLELRVGTKSAYFQTPGFEEAAERETKHDEAEERRLLYVAATRARDYLLLPAVLNKEKASGMLATLAECVPVMPDPTGEIIITDTVYLYDRSRISAESAPAAVSNPVRPDEVDAQEAARIAWQQDRHDLIERASKGLPLTFLDELDTWDDFVDADGDETGPERDVDEPKRIDRALHRVMARVDLQSGSNSTALCTLIAERAELSIEPDDLVALARSCLDTQVISRALAAKEIQREVSFSAYLGDGGFVEGQVDLLFSEGQELVIVDFRTDQIDTGEIDRRVEYFRENAVTRAVAFETATGLRVGQACLIFARAGVERSFLIDDEARGITQPR